MEELVKKLKSGIAHQVFTEAEKYGKQFEYQGTRIQGRCFILHPSRPLL